MAQAPAKPANDAAIEAAILALVEARGADKSICPSEAAKLVTADAIAKGAPADCWRQQMTPVRRVAVRLATEGRIDILRKGKKCDPIGEIKGVIRLRAGPDSGSKS